MIEPAEGKNARIMGGGDRAVQLHDAGLLDDGIIQMSPGPLDNGKQLFPRSARSPPWQLQSVRHIEACFAKVHHTVSRHSVTGGPSIVVTL